MYTKKYGGIQNINNKSRENLLPNMTEFPKILKKFLSILLKLFFDIKKIFIRKKSIKEKIVYNFVKINKILLFLKKSIFCRFICKIL